MRSGVFRTSAPIPGGRSPLHPSRPCQEMGRISCARRTARCSGSWTEFALRARVLARGSRLWTVSETVKKRPGEQSRIVPVCKSDAHGIATDGIQGDDPCIVKWLGRARRRRRTMTTTFRAWRLPTQLRGGEPDLFSGFKGNREKPPLFDGAKFLRPGRRRQSALSSR